MNFTKLFDYTQPLVAAATILGGAFIVLGGIGGVTAYQIKNAGDTVSVTGSARESVTADFARLVVNIETKTGTDDQEAGYARLDVAAKRIVLDLKKQGFADVEL